MPPPSIGGLTILDWTLLSDCEDNYPADRRAGDEIATHLPNIRQAFGRNRTFLQRAVRFLVAKTGIRQLIDIDIGAGLPAAGSVHDVARQEYAVWI